MLPVTKLKPDKNGFVTIKSSKRCTAKFIDIIPIEKAITHVREGSACVLNEHTIVKFHSQKQMRRIIFQRDKGICHYCGNPATTLDHKKPRSKGGCSTLANLVCCCRECNQKKGSLEYNEFLRIIGR